MFVRAHKPLRQLLATYGLVANDGRTRRTLLGVTIFNLGDSASVVAIPWIALQVAAPPQGALTVALSVAAISLPPIPVRYLLRKPMRRYSGAELVALEFTSRAVFLGLIPALF